jgi:RNA polymerase sigma factor (TIGR02999 family)
VCSLARPPGGSPEASLQYALRQRAEKTVMPLRNNRLPSEIESDELGKTPEERRALDQLFSVTYEELRRLASSVKRSDPGATLSPTTMVNEAWVKLAKSPGFASTSRLHFKRIAARAMRQVLVEAARRRNAFKRGGGEGVTVIVFDESQGNTASCGQDLLALDTALEELARIQPRQAMMVESRFFGGLDITETAALLEVSEATILRDWRAAKAWLAHELRRAQ